MKTLKQLREMVQEAKQVGDIYHFTTTDSLHHIINGDDPYSLYSRNGHSISTTRNKHLTMTNKNFRHCNVKITLNGDKISNNHKITPIAGRTNSEDSPWPITDDAHRMNRKHGEAEELILHHPFNIKKYIKHVHILSHREGSDADKLYHQEIHPTLKKDNVPHDYTKSFNQKETDVNENWLGWHDTDDTYLLIEI